MPTPPASSALGAQPPFSFVPSNLVVSPADSSSKRACNLLPLHQSSPSNPRRTKEHTTCTFASQGHSGKHMKPHVSRKLCHLHGVTPFTTTVLFHCRCTMAPVQGFSSVSLCVQQQQNSNSCVCIWGLRSRGRQAQETSTEVVVAVVVQLACGRGGTPRTHVTSAASGRPELPPLETAAADGGHLHACRRPRAGPAVRAGLSCFLDGRALQRMPTFSEGYRGLLGAAGGVQHPACTYCA